MEFRGRRLFILIADDNQDLATSLTLLLSLAGFEVEAVHDGRAALERLKEPRASVFSRRDHTAPGTGT
jgi:CheY-like chemotaxis protein